MEKYIKSILISFSLLFSISGCSDYLNIVPDNTATVDKMFENKEKTIQALATCYAYIPDVFNNHYLTSLTLGNEYVAPVKWNFRSDVFISNRVMMGDQNVDNPYYSYWNGGTGGARNIYQGIRYCNIFLNNIKQVPDLEPGDYEDYIAQVKFIKAYLHFILLKNYGPIVIADKEMDINASQEEIHQYREPVDKVFQYIVNLMEESVPELPVKRMKSQIGQIDQIIAKSMKAKVLLFWASPLFNGNSEYYSNFIDPKTGAPLFNLKYNHERWGEAVKALEVAINAAHAANVKLYTYQKPIYEFDKEDSKTSEIMEYAYNNRFSIVDPWNIELIWGYSNVNPTGAGSMQSACQVFNIELPNNWNYSYNYLAATQTITEQFYTKHGVLMDEDKTFEYESRNNIVNVPIDNYHRGFLIPDDQEVISKQYLNREPRFYAWIATDRSIWRTYGTKYTMRMRFNETPGGGNVSLNGEFYPSGIAIKKWVHPESQNGAWQRVVQYPYPMLRLADLYLMYAEALNEYSGPTPEVYKYLNMVRERAGLPKVEEVWSNSEIVKEPGKHLTKEGLREIIHQERAIELSFEGHQYDDVRRWKEGDKYFTKPVQGWNSFQQNAENFYTPVTLQTRHWITPRDYLTPLSISLLNVNPNLVQNPGW
ncbi:MAG: RagB/SusD family nutrient uptake outer membrane protein [Dysgonamonadaceae bacterium]|nr:RagB/SusD family nutrient uptake outer membrane protein [Dysgonamonadaceae bacterium]